MENKHPFMLIKNINDKFEAKGNNECQKAGITLTQFRILMYLLANPDKQVTQREMELEFKVSHPTICGILNRMEEKKLISTSIVIDKKQQRKVSITEKGKEALKEILPSRNEDDKAMLSLFTSDELNNLDDYLRRILNYLNSSK